MYTKEQLEKMAIPELMEVAAQYGVKVSQDDTMENVIYDILDKAAIDSAAGGTTAIKKKRTRIAKKDTDRVYTVSGKEGENLDVKTQKGKNVEAPSLFADMPAQPVTEEQPAEEAQAPAPKKRGRKSKAELAAIAEAEAAKAQKAAEEMPAEEQPLQEADAVPEEAGIQASVDDAPDAGMLEQLQEHMTHHVQEGDYVATDEDGYWEGDPADGTDFITVVDLTIEDQAAIPTLDIFDRPVVAHQPEPVFQPVSQADNSSNAHYDFGDIIEGKGVLELMQDGYGFLRSSDYNYLSSPDDIYVAPQQIKRYGLKTGDVVDCTVRPPHDNEKYFAMSTVKSINGREPSEVRDRVSFEHLTPLFPEEKFMLCGDPATTNPSTRIVDLFAPIGKG